MPLPSIVHSSTGVELKPAPINPDWVLEGSPTARNAELSRSRDGTACTLIWDCTPGKFVWHYHMDETIHILEGSIVLDDGNAAPRRLGPGDVVFFPAGAVVRWHVEAHVRKLAFFRRVMPKPVELVTRALWAVKRLLRPAPEAGDGRTEMPGQSIAIGAGSALARQ